MWSTHPNKAPATISDLDWPRTSTGWQENKCTFFQVRWVLGRPRGRATSKVHWEFWEQSWGWTKKREVLISGDAGRTCRIINVLHVTLPTRSVRKQPCSRLTFQSQVLGTSCGAGHFFPPIWCWEESGEDEDRGTSTSDKLQMSCRISWSCWQALWAETACSAVAPH